MQVSLHDLRNLRKELHQFEHHDDEVFQVSTAALDGYGSDYGYGYLIARACLAGTVHAVCKPDIALCLISWAFSTKQLLRVSLR